MTMVELVIAMGILAVALTIFSGTIAATTRQRVINRENARAAEGARLLLERMRDETFEELFARFNADPLDDPDGPGTAPSNRFAVSGLEPLPTAADGLVGEVLFPVRNVGTAATPVWQLREDVRDRSLGMPRDLNGDLVTDGEDHASDYFILPVTIRIEWQSEGGRRLMTLHAMLCDYDYGD